MASFDLPRPLPDYFAFAETTPTRDGRRFSITLPYVGTDGRIGRLQWWYHLSEGKQKIMGEEEAVQALRAEAIDRFRTHIERWLQHTAQALSGEGPIPQLLPQGENAGNAQAPPATVGLTPPPEQNLPSPGQMGQTSEASASEPVPVPAGKTAFG